MAVFNFEIKRQSYELALNRTREALSAGDVGEGKYYLSVAIGLCAQLTENCVAAIMRDRYAAEHRKLISLRESLEKGVNPFAGRAVSPPPASAPAFTPSDGVSGGGETDGSEKRKNTGTAVGGGEKPSARPNKLPNGGASDREEDKAKKSQFFASEIPSTTLDDVAGLEDVKKQIRLRVIAPMKNPGLYDKYMDDAGCQILMYGPPGCGKSFVAEAIAGELGCAYAILSASELLEKYVGEGSKKVAQIFKEAKEYDRCLIFFDELDSVFSSRERDDSKYTKDILTTFLTCLSGFRAKEGGVRIIIGATNRPWALDSALIRGKRFDTHIYVGLPDENARAFLVSKAFKKHESLLEDSDLTQEALVGLFDGYSCADISSMLDKMKTRAFERALDNSERGVEKNEPITLADATAVLSRYRNPITKESLKAFKAFEKGEI